jgi:hypothetical protein
VTAVPFQVDHAGREKPCADCAAKAQPAVPPDSVSNAAALFVSVGNVNGFCAGADWAADAIDGARAELLRPLPWWTPRRVRQALEARLVGLAGQFRQTAQQKRAEAGPLEKAAKAMAQRIDRPRPRRHRWAFPLAVANLLLVGPPLVVLAVWWLVR